MVCICHYTQDACKTVQLNVKAGRKLAKPTMTTTTDNLPTSYFMHSGTDAELSREQLTRHVPSAYAEKAYAGTSSRYAFFPTDTVVEALRESGWAPGHLRSAAESHA